MKPSLITLCMLMSFPIVGAVLFTPALSHLIEHFEISAKASQLSVATYLAGYALGQLPYGFLANRFGRKKAIYIGLVVFMIGSFCCANTQVFGVLIAARALMALGAAVGLIMAFTLVSDFFSVQEARRMLAYMTLSAAIAPGLANLIGGYLTGYLGWQSCFYFLIGYAGLVIAMVYRIPDLPNARAFAKSNLRACLDTLRQGRFLLFTVLAALTTAVIYIFAATAPLIAVHVMEIAPQVYGLMSIAPFLGTSAGCLFTAHLAHRFSGHTMMKIGLCACLAGALSKFVLVQVFGSHVWLLFLPMPLMYFGLPIIYTNAGAIGLGGCKNKSIASSIYAAANISFAFLGVTFVGSFELHSLSEIALIFVGISVAMIITFACASRFGASKMSLESPRGS